MTTTTRSTGSVAKTRREAEDHLSHLRFRQQGLLRRRSGHSLGLLVVTTFFLTSKSCSSRPFPVRSDGRQCRGLRFLHSTANPVYDQKNVVRTPDFKDRLDAARTAKKAQIERARTIAEDPARLRRIEARSEIIATRNIRIAERERVRREAIERQAAERAAAEAAEAAAQAARKAEEEAREARRVAQARRDAAAAEREEALLAIRRAGRKKKCKRH
jgi:Family of unknown function (DUF6481)